MFFECVWVLPSTQTHSKKAMIVCVFHFKCVLDLWSTSKHPNTSEESNGLCVCELPAVYISSPCPKCCVWFRSRENPSSQPPLLAAPWLEAVSAQPDCCSGVKLKPMLYKCFFLSCPKLSSSRQTQGVMIAALSRWHEFASPVRSFSFAQLCWSGFISTQHIIRKLDRMCGKSQLFHMTRVIGCPWIILFKDKKHKNAHISATVSPIYTRFFFPGSWDQGLSSQP